MNPRRLISALLLSSMFGGAFAQSVTYDWTGVVTGVSGSTGSLVDGSTVNGTITVDLDAPAYETFGTIGDPVSGFILTNQGGPGAPGNSPLPIASFYNETFTGGGLLISTGPIQANDEYFISRIDANTYQDPTYEVYAASQSPSTYTYAGLSFQDVAGDGKVPWSLSGLPAFSAGNLNSGEVIYSVGGAPDTTVSYSFRSFSPANVLPAVPETSGYIVFAIGLIFLCLKRRRRLIFARQRNDAFTQLNRRDFGALASS